MEVLHAHCAGLDRENCLKPGSAGLVLLSAFFRLV
jgi:hypothetical protein